MRSLQEHYGGLGKFRIGRSFIYNSHPGALQAIMFGLIIIHADWDSEGGEIVYTAFHPDFEEHIQPGQMLPEYDAIVSAHPSENAEPTFTVQWLKKEWHVRV